MGIEADSCMWQGPGPAWLGFASDSDVPGTSDREVAQGWCCGVLSALSADPEPSLGQFTRKAVCKEAWRISRHHYVSLACAIQSCLYLLNASSWENYPWTPITGPVKVLENWRGSFSPLVSWEVVGGSSRCVGTDSCSRCLRGCHAAACTAIGRKKTILLPSGIFSLFFSHFKPRLSFVVTKCCCDDARAYNSAASGSHFLHSESKQEAGLVEA